MSDLALREYGTGVGEAGLGGRDTYWDAYASYASHYGTAAPQPLPSNQAYINGTPFASLVGTSTGNGWFYAADPNNASFQIGYNVLGGGWDYRNTVTGNGVVADGLVTTTTTSPGYGGTTVTSTVPAPATSYDQAYQAKFGDAPGEYPE